MDTLKPDETDELNYIWRHSGEKKRKKVCFYWNTLKPHDIDNLENTRAQLHLEALSLDKL